MRLWVQSLRLGNFGSRRDWDLSSLEPGLNLLYGPNESGKTTLLMFLRAMLFGFDRSTWLPLRGGDPGGVLTLADDQGRQWRLERWGRGKKARVHLSGPGVAGGEAGLQTLLSQVSRPVYENVFAFGLKELSDLKSLDQQGVKELLYSASLGLGRVSLTQVEAEVQKEAEALFNPRAAKPAINQVLTELAGVRRTIAALEQQPEEYRAIREELTRLEADILALTRKRQAAAAERQRLRQLAQAWPVWETWQETQADFEALPRVENFPENGLSRLERLREEQERLQAQLGEGRQALEAAQTELQALQPDAALLAQAAPIEALWDERLLFGTRREELARKEQEQAAARTRLAESLAQLGPGWDEARLAAFPLSLAWRHGLQEQQQRLGEARLALNQAETQEQLREEALQERQAAWQEANEAGLAGTTGWVGRWGLVLLGALLASAAGGLALVRAWPFALGTATGAGVAFFLALIFWGHRRALYRRRLSALAEDRDRAASVREQVRMEREKAQAALDRLQEGWRDWLAADGLPPNLTPEAVLELSRELERARGHLQYLRTVQEERHLVEQCLEEFTARLAAILRSLGRPEVSVAEANFALVNLRQELQRHQETHRRKTALEAETAALKAQVSQGSEAAARLTGLIQELFQAAGVQGEEEFRQRWEIYSRRQELLEKGRHLTVQLRLLAGGEEALAAFLEELGAATRADLEARLEQSIQEVADLDSRLAQAQEAKGRLTVRREHLERAGELGEALFQEQTLAARLAELGRRWTVLTVCRTFLEQGRRRFEAECQPQVLQEAGRYLAEFTHGRYLRVMAPLGDEKILVVDRQGRHLPGERLSRGTVEQLYLALRFAMIRSYHLAGMNLPLVLDDTLVNFDHRRSREAVRLLAEMGASHQVLYFTCHSHMVSLMAEVLGEAAPAPLILEEPS